MGQIDIEKALAELAYDILDMSRVSDILNNPKEFPVSLVEELSIKTALKYWEGNLHFEDADCIVNNLYFFWVCNEYFVTKFSFPDAAWECFLAFDAGEFHHPNDDSSINPEEKYTRPLVKKLLKKSGLIE